jgi:hypothetical protein
VARPVVTIDDVRAMAADPEMLHTARAILNAIGRAKGGEDGDQIEVNVAGALNAMLFAGAMMIDLDPALQTRKDMQQASGDAAQLLEMLLLVLREMRTETGHHLVETIGSGHSPRLQPGGGKTRVH